VETLRRYLDQSRRHLQNQNPHYFSGLLPSNQHWRLFPEFRHLTAYLDIETTGMDGYYDDITIIGLYDGTSLFHYVKDQNLDDFREDVNKNVNTFLTTEPFKGRQEKMNFYRVDKLEELDCEIDAWVKCDEFSVKKLASYCPNDYIVILVDRGKVRDLISPVRSSAISNMAKINTADNELVVLHEFGHIFGGLADEYVDEKYYSNIGWSPLSYPNCDSPPDCNGWRGVDGTGCFEGCSLKKYSRPTENSLMRSLKTEKFGPLNERIIIGKLDVYGGEGEE